MNHLSAFISLQVLFHFNSKFSVLISQNLEKSDTTQVTCQCSVKLKTFLSLFKRKFGIFEIFSQENQAEAKTCAVFCYFPCFCAGESCYSVNG